MKSVTIIGRWVLALATLALVSACGGGGQKAAQANADLGNDAITKMNYISDTRLPHHGISLNDPQNSKEAIQQMNEDELVKVDNLLNEYINDGKTAQYAANQPNVDDNGVTLSVSYLVSMAADIKDSVDRRLERLKQHDRHL